MIVGTAGHIDHGKSALVTALTGHAVDRLAEEQRRGITLDLNFAPLRLPSGEIAGVVDVPGHEDLVRTMVAGASGMDLALLVIAADEGIMPQTEEHIVVLEQLGLPRLLPVITKCDLVEPAWLELVLADVERRLSGTAIERDPPAAVSARTGQGVAELRERVIALVRSARRRDPRDLFRLPVDRAFSIAGTGTVVTGTAWSGSVRVGDAVRILPSGAEGRVRSIESFGQPLGAVVPGARVALGVAGLSRSDCGRGSTVIPAGVPWEPSRALDVLLRLHSAAPRPILRRTRLRLHLGTSEVMAWAVPREAVQPGGAGLARLVLESPMMARGGDRFVVRSFSPVRTIGGGEVLDPAPPERGAGWPPELTAADPAIRLPALAARRRQGLRIEELPVVAGLAPHRAADAAAAAAGVVVAQGRLLARGVVEAARHRLERDVDAWHREHPTEAGAPLGTLRAGAGLAGAAVDLALAESAAAGAMVLTGGMVARAGFRPSVAGGEAAVERLVGLLEAAGLAPPTVAELGSALGRADAADLARVASNAGRIERVERDRYYARSALDRFAAELHAVGGGGAIAVPVLRERLGLSRKFLIPLLEWADRTGITIRTGDERRLRTAGSLDTPPERRSS